ncbi:hypothetical protein IG631_13666 [Alternaria alternata]|nr:hypothetical protein IG631_13666 [Alternaria alternata]
MAKMMHRQENTCCVVHGLRRDCCRHRDTWQRRTTTRNLLTYCSARRSNACTTECLAWHPHGGGLSHFWGNCIADEDHSVGNPCSFYDDDDVALKRCHLKTISKRNCRTAI